MDITPDDVSTKKKNSRKSNNTASDQSLFYLAFDNTLQPNIITTVSSGRIIMANKAACILLGYAKGEIITKTISDLFDITENSLQKMLNQRTIDGHAKAFLTLVTKSGSSSPCAITSSVFEDEDHIARAITTISDMSEAILTQKKIDRKKEKAVAADIVIAKQKQQTIDRKKKKIVEGNIVIARSKQRRIDVKKEKIVADNIVLALLKSDTRLAENNEWIKYIAKASYDVMWDWDIVTGEIYVGDSLEETFGYKVQNNTIHLKQFLACLLPGDKAGIEKKLLYILESRAKGWNDAFSIKRYDGTTAATISRASIIRNGEGKAIRLIGATQDVSVLQQLENELSQKAIIKKDDSNIFNLAAKLYYDGIWEWNILTGEFFLGEGFEALFGYSYDNTYNIVYDWNDFLHPDDKDMVEKAIEEALASASTQWSQAFRFIRADGSVANVFGRASIIRDVYGKGCRMIGVIHDISKQHELEENLDQEIKLKEQQIAEAIDDAKDAERSDIGKELHDNVNQLLGASRMFLEMAKKKGPNSELYLSRSSEYTLTAIEEIRKLTRGLTTDIIRDFGLGIAISKIIGDTMEASQINITQTLGSFIEHSVNDKFKLNMFRIVQEHLTNILKHAKAKQVNISITQNEQTVVLSITDDGIGFDTALQSGGIGIANIKSRAAAYDGTVDLFSEPGNGCNLIIIFQLTSLIKNVD